MKRGKFEFGVGVGERTLSLPVFEVVARREIKAQICAQTLWGQTPQAPKKKNFADLAYDLSSVRTAVLFTSRKVRQVR